MDPRKARIKRPIFQGTLRQLRKVMELKNSQLELKMWALWLFQWQGVMRCRDLVKRRNERKGNWDPARDKHRGWLKIEVLRDEYGTRKVVKLVLAQKPSNTDQEGGRKFETGFVIDQESQSLSAGKALWDMLRKDQEVGRPEDTPLFRKHRRGEKVTYEESSAHMNNALKMERVDASGFSTRSLRMEGATAYANSPAGGELVAGFMGCGRPLLGTGILMQGAPSSDP